MLFSVPQTISIAIGAALITVIDYRLLIVAMAAVFALASAYLFTRARGGDARDHACSFSRSSRLTTFGSALPCVSFITWPTRKPSTPSLPPR